jgi:hypothetical protein
LALNLDTDGSEDPLTGRRRGHEVSTNLNQSTSRYYLTRYLANKGVNIGDLKLNIARADIFTYTLDPFGEPSLVFLGAINEVPEAFREPPARLAYEAAVESLSENSRTELMDFSHYFTTFYDAGF